jgi:hypothetical protein
LKFGGPTRHRLDPPNLSQRSALARLVRSSGPPLGRLCHGPPCLQTKPQPLFAATAPQPPQKQQRQHHTANSTNHHAIAGSTRGHDKSTAEESPQAGRFVKDRQEICVDCSAARILWQAKAGCRLAVQQHKEGVEGRTPEPQLSSSHDDCGFLSDLKERV